MMRSRRSITSRFTAGETLVTAWSTLAPPVLAELLARSGYGAVTLDMQHGAHDVSSVQDGISATVFGGAHPIVRPPVDDFATVSRAFDFGAEAVIMPMINSRDDARMLVDAAKYPPDGARSWGPQRAAMVHGMTLSEYHKTANDEVLVFAMVETPKAVSALDEILDVAGLGGIFIGPADLSLTLSGGAAVDPGGARVQTLAGEIARKTRDAGKVAGIYTNSLEDAKAAQTMGFQLIAYGSDAGLFSAAAHAQAHALD